jgi:uncharacterized iron-regulated membrane protein
MSTRAVVNKALFKIHSGAALFALIPLLIICISGSILVFKHEVDALLMRDKVRVQTYAKRLPLQTLLATINREYANHEVVGWVLFQDAERADVVYVMQRGSDEWSYLLLDSYSGKVLAAPVPTDHYFTDWLLELHSSLLLHDAGLLLASVFASALLALGITGLILHRKFWKNFFTLRWNARLVVYFSDLHKMIGVVSSPVLIILAFTGIWWNISSFLHELEEHADGHEHHIMQERLYSSDLSFDAIVTEAEQSIAGFNATYLSFPWQPGATITVWGDVPTDNMLSSQYSSRVSFDAQTGSELALFDIRDAGAGAFIVDTYRRLHYGDFAGLFSRILWCALGSTPLIMSITGITLWLKRRKQRARRLTKRSNKSSVEFAH